MSVILALAVASTALPPICADRPAKANGTCTVPKGKLQVETGIAGWSLTKSGGTRTEITSVGSTVLKLGLSDHSDLELGITPCAKLIVSDAVSRTQMSGFGDLVIRYKHRFTSEGAKAQVALIPFVKVPTASRNLGNGKVEGGLAVPVSIAASPTVSVTFGPELDLLADADGQGRHVAVVNLVNVGMPIAPRLFLAGELWTNFNFDPSGTIKQASADASLAYAASNSVQLDAGANFGLTRETPDVELYGGISVRF